MTAVLNAVRIDARDPRRVARFWTGVLDWELVDAPDGVVVCQPHDGTAYRITVHEVDTPKPDQNRIHFDVTSSSEEAMQATVARALELGGSHLDIGQTQDDRHVVLADPEGNELCVIEPGNAFLADTGIIGAINCDGSRAVGHFWSRALEWPLVWDQDEETAIQAPTGGSKITWSGPPLCHVVAGTGCAWTCPSPLTATCRQRSAGSRRSARTRAGPSRAPRAQ